MADDPIERTLQYTYDALSRLIEADDGVSPVTYGYDLAGNLVNLDGTMRTYNAANQMTHDGTNTLTYDPNGNLTSDGTNTYIWDRANRLLSMGGVSYGYDGLGNRISQDNGVNEIKYLLDLQPGLTQVLSATIGTNATRFVYSPKGLHVTQNPAGDWFYGVQDGLGSQRAEVNANGVVVASQRFGEYGVVQDVMGSFSSSVAFTGEPLDTNGLQYHRARYYAPNMGTWINEDFLETPNRYSYVSGNPINRVDPSGLISDITFANSLNSSFCHTSSVLFQDERDPCRYCNFLEHTFCSLGITSPCSPHQLLEQPSGHCKVFIAGRQGASGGVWEHAFPIVIHDPGTKLDQAKNAVNRTANCSGITVAGYSWGADSTIIFANLSAKPIRGLALLGATLTGDAGVAGNVRQIWEQTLTKLLRSGTPVYVLNDASTPLLNSIWTSFQSASNSLYFKYDSQPARDHFDRWGANRIGSSTNNDPALVVLVSGWLSATVGVG